MTTQTPLKFTEDNVERLYRAIDHNLDCVIFEDNEVVVYDEDSDSGSGYMVDASTWTCGCDDSEYNLTEGELCKHRWFVLLERNGLL